MGILIRVLKLLLPLGVLGVATLAAIIMIRNRPEVVMQIPEVAPPGVRAHLVEVKTVAVPVTSQGTVRPRTETQIVPEIAGRVTWVAPSFAVGGFFEEGDVLLRIDPFDYQQAVISARSQLAQSRLRLAQEEAEAEVARREWEELGRGDPRELTLRKPQLEDAQASVAAAEAALVRAERDLERAEVRAPYAGRVRTKSVDVGQFVTVGAPIATVYAVDLAEVRLPLPDEELAYLDLPLAFRGTANRRGPRVTLRTAFAGDTYEWVGQVVRTESEIDPVSRMVHVIAEVQDPYAPGPDRNRPPLAVGMYVEADIEGRPFDEVVVVPRAALQGRSQVLVIDADSRVRFRDIDILRTTTESVYVRNGLAEGELVAISALDGPTEGMQVQITELSVDGLAQAAPTPPVRAPATVAESSGMPARPEPLTETAVVTSAVTTDAGRPAWLLEVYRESRESGSRTARRETIRPSSPAPQTRVAILAVPAPESAPPPEPPAPSAPIEDVAVAAREPEAAPVAVAIDRSTAVAVLPFADINQGGTSDLDEGMTRAVFARLADLESVMVVSSETEAWWVVGGSVQQIGDTVRVTARVVDTRDGGVVRAVKVDGTASDLPRVHNEVTAAIQAGIVEALGVTTADSPRTPDLVIRRFENVTQMPTDADVASAFVDAVTARLLDVGTVNIVTDESTAAWVITGAVQRVGDIVRVTATLIDVARGAIVRAVKVDGPIEGLAQLQSDVAAELSNSVRKVTS